jgi:hypothetical protein
MKKGETFANLLICIWLNEFAYTASVNVLQKTAKSLKL